MTALGVALLVAVAVLLFADPLLRGAAGMAGRAAGYRVSYDTLRARHGHLVIEGPDVASFRGEPVFTAQRIDVAYDLGAVFGGPYLYGISGIEIDRPKITIVHHRDGTYNINLPQNNANQNAAPPAIPQIHVIVKDGSFGIVDETRIFAHSRRIAVEAIQLDADLHPKARSAFTLALSILEDGGKYPLAGRGVFDESRGYEMARLRAKSLNLAPLIDYALNSMTLHVAGGVLNDIDARVYGLLAKDGTMARHFGATANLDHFQPYLGGIAKPLRDGRGALRVYDDGLTFPKVDGSIAGVPVRIAGGIYGLASPMLRIGIAGRGDLRRLVTLSDAARKLPVSGPLAFSLFVEGPAALPTTFVLFSSPRISYAKLPLDRPSGYIGLRGQETDILRTGLDYDGIAVGARGGVTLAKHTAVEMFARVSAPAGRVPYAAQLLGPMQVGASVVAAGTDADLQTSGVLGGSSRGERLAGTFDVAGNGTGTVGPIALDGPGARSVFVRVALDRPHAGGGAAFLSARALHLSTGGKQPTLPGMSLPTLPAADVTLDANAAGALAGRRFAFGGDADAYHAHALGYPIDDVTARAQVVQGPRLLANVRYRGALAPLAAAAGGKIAATGRVDIPVTIVADGTNRALAQISQARFYDVRVAGVAVQGLDATVGVRGKAVDVYAARIRAGGNTVVARGSFGNGGTLDVSAGGVNLAALRSLGVPVRAGSLTAVATLAGSVNAPAVHAGIAASGVRLTNPAASRFPVDANTDLAYDGDALQVRDTLVHAGPAVAALDGSVHGLRGDPARATYAFDARVRQADLGALARAANAPLAYPAGSLEASVRVRGSGSNPGVDGTVEIPEGSVNGLAFRDASVVLSGSAQALHAHDGHVTVGTSTIDFAANASSTTQSFAMHAPAVDLSDLNDYFDAGDTLGGKGSIDAGVRNEPDRIVTSGRVRLVHTKFHRFDLGATDADWSTQGRRVTTALALGGTAGRIQANGHITLPATAPLRNTFARSTVALDSHVRKLDLGTWLPAAGIIAPVFGTVDADATVHGTYPALSLTANASLADGKVRDVPIRTGTLALDANEGRVTIRNALVAIDNAQVTASGYAGVRPNAPFDVTVTARSDDIGALAKTLGERTLDAAGSLTDVLQLSGTQARPQLADTLDAANLRFDRFTVPRVHAVARVTTTQATLETAEVDFASGRILATASTPIVERPAFSIPVTTPLHAQLTAQQVGLAQFAALLPKGTSAAGAVDGTVALAGTRRDPGLRGDLTLRGGEFAGPQLRSRLSDATLELVFDNRTITLRNTSAKVGGGTIGASGSVTVPDLRDPMASTSANLALTSNYAVLDAPQYIKGRVNGTVTLTRAPRMPAQVGGSIAFSSTRIPTALLLPSGGPSPAASTAPLPVAFDLDVTAGDDVRVQGGPVDIGAKGLLHVGGTLAAPTVAGHLDSTGGTLSFYRTFQLQYPSVVTFDPSNGVIPYVDALATTSVDNPPTDVQLHVTGLATSLSVALNSDPSYSREQILGLLVGAQALGAVSGVATGSSSGPQQNPFQALAEGQLGNLLTQNVLEPFSSQLGSAVGLNNLAINYTPGGGASVGAQKKLLKNVNAIFAQSFGQEPRESVGLIASPNNATALQLTFFSQPSANKFDVFQGAQNVQSFNSSVTDTEPALGTSGFSISLQKKF